jgi:hypothetical protein
MTFQVLVVAYRKPGLSLAEFKELYENHVRLLQRLSGPDFPLTHARRYIARTEQPETAAAEDASQHRNAKTPATVLIGSPADFDYDAIAELTFADQVAFQGFAAKIGAPKVAKEIAEDEEKFLDRPKLGVVVLGDVVETARGS